MKNRKIDAIVSYVVHALESTSQRKQHVFVASVGTVGTLLLWWVHLTHPAMFANAFLRGRVSPMWLVLALAPPFVMAFGLGNVFFFKPAMHSQASGPMSGYLYRQESEKRWKIMVASGIAAAANFLFMLVTAGTV